MKASKKLLSLLLVVMLLVSAIPFQVFAKTPNENGSITVPVTVKFDGRSYSKSITIPADTDVTLDEDFAMDPANNLVTNATDKVFGAWYSSTSTEPVTNKELSYAWLKDEAPEDYALTLEMNPKTAPATYTATLKAKLDGTEVGSDSKSGITEIELTEALAKSLYSGFDASKHEFKGWEGGLSGKQTLTANATFTAVFETKTTPTKPTLTVKVFVNNVGKADFTRQTDSVTLNKTLYEDIMNAGSLGNVDDYVFNFYDGTAISGTSLNGSTYTLTADRTFTIVIKTKPADPVKKNVTFFVDGKQYAVTECTEGQLPVIPQAPYKANYTFQGWFSAENGAGSKLIANQNWDNNKPVLYYAYFTSNLNPAYDTITVYVQRYVGNVAKGAKEELTIADNQLLRGERILPWLNSKTTEIDSLIDTKYGTDYTWDGYFYDNDSNAKLTSQDQTTNGNKRVFIKIQVAEVKVQLYIHKDKISASPVIKDMHGFRIGDTISKSIDVDPLVKKYYTGSKMTIQGLYTEEDYNDLLKNLTPTAAQDLRVTEAGMEIHVIVKNGTASTADPSNPKTGDYILSTAMTLMVISGLAAAAVYVVGKKRRV